MAWRALIVVLAPVVLTWAVVETVVRGAGCALRDAWLQSRIEWDAIKAAWRSEGPS